MCLHNMGMLSCRFLAVRPSNIFTIPNESARNQFTSFMVNKASVLLFCAYFCQYMCVYTMGMLKTLGDYVMDSTTQWILFQKHCFEATTLSYKLTYPSMVKKEYLSLTDLPLLPHRMQYYRLRPLILLINLVCITWFLSLALEPVLALTLKVM